MERKRFIVRYCKDLPSAKMSKRLGRIVASFDTLKEAEKWSERYLRVKIIDTGG